MLQEPCLVGQEFGGGLHKAGAFFFRAVCTDLNGCGQIQTEDTHEAFGIDSGPVIAYQNPEGYYFMFQTLPAEGSLSIDTENAEAAEFLLNGMQAIQIRQESEHTLRTIWVDPNRQRLFDVSSNGMAEEDFKQHILDLSAMLMAPELYAD